MHGGKTFLMVKLLRGSSLEKVSSLNSSSGEIFFMIKVRFVKLNADFLSVTFLNSKKNVDVEGTYKRSFIHLLEMLEQSTKQSHSFCHS